MYIICLCADDDSKNLLIIVGSRCFPRSHPAAKTAFVCVLSLMFILTFFFRIYCSYARRVPHIHNNIKCVRRYAP